MDKMVYNVKMEITSNTEKTNKSNTGDEKPMKKNKN